MKTIQGHNAIMTIGECDDNYHASSGLSSSALRLFHEGPEVYWSNKICPDPDKADEDEKEKDSFLIGKCGHCMVLEPERLESSFVSMEEGATRRGKEWASFQTLHMGKKILTYKSYLTARRCAESMMRHSSTMAIKAGLGLAETSVRWMQEVVYQTTGEVFSEECKIRMDYHLPPSEELPNGVIYDVKFEAESDPYSFQRSAYEWGYRVQTAMYQNGYMKFYGTTQRPEFIFIVAKKKYPYTVVDYVADEAFIASGQAIFDRRLPEFYQCRRTGIWAPRFSTTQQLRMPRWAKENFDE